MSDFKWGLIGPGRIAQRFAGALSADFVGSLHAVASRNEARATAFAEQFGAAKIYNNYDALLADDDIDAVYIATPHAFHFALAKQCLLAGKPVLCEKPLTVTAEQSQALIDIARENKVFLMEAMWSPLLPIHVQVKQWVDQGLIGDVKCIHSTFGFNMPRDDSDRWLNPALAGGVLLDMGVYNIALSHWYMGDTPSAIHATGQVGATGVDEFVAANMIYSNNRYAQFMCNFDAQTDNTLWINGSKGRICVEPMFWDTTKAKLIIGDTVEAVEKPFAATGFEYEIAEAERCIQSGMIESPSISHEFTLQSMQSLDNILSQLGVVYPDSITAI